MFQVNLHVSKLYFADQAMPAVCADTELKIPSTISPSHFPREKQQKKKKGNLLNII